MRILKFASLILMCAHVGCAATPPKPVKSINPGAKAWCHSMKKKYIAECEQYYRAWNE